MPFEALMGSGGVLGGFGDIYGGFSEAGALRTEASAYKANAKLARERARIDEFRQRNLSYKALSSIRAGYGAAGVVSTEGSALDVLEESAATAELDALLIRHAGEVQARNYEAAAKAAKSRARGAEVGGVLSGVGKIFGGFG